jgi:peptidyl-prolyl cis-trans isomerase A (cyclophilin A)
MISAAALLLLAQVAIASPAAPPAASPTPRPTPSGPVVVLETSLGRIKIGLYDDKSPVSTENFLKYVRKGQYNGTLFHRVMPNFMIPGGGMTQDMNEKPTDPPIRNEARNGVRTSRGTVAMARTNAPDSATAQFFINVRDNPSLDYGIRGAGYAVFGEVIEGMDVVDKITGVATTTKGIYQNVPVTPIVLKRAREAGGAAAPAATNPAPAKPASPKPAASAKPTPKP